MRQTLEEKCKELKATIDILQAENKHLSERDESTLLIRMVAETISSCDDSQKLLDRILEQVSVLKNIPYCACFEIQQDTIKEVSNYYAYSNINNSDHVIALPTQLKESLKEEVCSFNGAEFQELGLQTCFEGCKFEPKSALFCTFSSKLIEHGTLIFVDDFRDETMLKTDVMLLHHITDMIAEKLDKISLINELKQFNMELEHRVRERTKSLAKINNRLEIEIQEHNLAQKERLQSEKELLKLRNYLSNIIDSMPSVLVGVDAECKITQWNRKAERVTGIPASEAWGKRISDIIPHLKSELDTIRESIQTGKPKSKINKPQQASTGIRYEDLTIYPLSSGGAEGAVIRIDDVSERVKLEERIHHNQKMDAIGHLAGGVAHDFNNMLAGILGAADLLKLRLKKSDGKVQNLIDMILQASTRASELTSKLLTFGRKGRIKSEAINLHKVIEESTSILKRTVDKRVRIIVNDKAKNSTITGDGTGLQNAIINMGINACHAMPTGGDIVISTKNIRLTKEDCKISPFNIEPGEYLKIVLTDSGCGIHPNNLEKIFDPFFTTKEQGLGTGLGLTAVYGTIKNHHGEIKVSSELGNGTSFNILLPCSENDTDPDLIDKSVASGSGTILLTDDEELIRITGQMMLEGMGYKVLLAKNGKQAVKIFKKQHAEIDLVLMDMMMPVMNGYDAFLKIKEIDPECKVIISSGFSEQESLLELGKSGLHGFIHKPFRDYELSHLLVKTLKSR